MYNLIKGEKKQILFFFSSYYIPDLTTVLYLFHQSKFQVQSLPIFVILIRLCERIKFSRQKKLVPEVFPF